MIDKEKYSKQAFESIRHDPALVRALIEDLQLDVAKDFQETIELRMREITSELNSVGHHLKENESEGPEETDFCEFHHDESQESCGFRLGTYFTVCAGYYKIGEEYLRDE